jgi:thymidine kinase
LAQYSYRKNQNDNIVLLGEVNEYEPLSRAAYNKAILRDKVRSMKVNEAKEIISKPKDSNA